MARALVASFDETLLSKARSVGMLLEFTGDAIEFDYSPAMMPAYEGGPEPEYFELYSDGIDEGFRSATLGEADLPLRGGLPEAPERWDLVLPDGRQGRALGVRLITTAPDHPEIPPAELPGVTVVVARSRESLDALLNTLVLGLLGAAGAALGLLVWGVRIGVKRGLAPIDRLAEEVTGVDATSLSRRVGTNGTPVELRPLAEKVNELLGRIEAAFARQSRMTAAMAHELRTPIAELRLAADIARRWPDDEPMAMDVVKTAADVSLRMSSAVESVMRYCWMEAGQADPELEAISLHALLEELWAPHDAPARERDVVLDNQVPEGAVTLSDRGLLSLILSNLLNNAASFASAGPVRASVAAHGATLTLQVANRTDHLAPEDLDHLGEPFWRKDGARTSGRHSGLGLALVRSVAGVLGHETCFSLENGEFAASLELPAA
ncbi:MAG: HAMP domain-containing sensor histidine kinase [Planctomycetota bacterium]